MAVMVAPLLKTTFRLLAKSSTYIIHADRWILVIAEELGFLSSWILVYDAAVTLLLVISLILKL
jgi:hypothetical protein